MCTGSSTRDSVTLVNCDGAHVCIRMYACVHMRVCVCVCVVCVRAYMCMHGCVGVCVYDNRCRKWSFHRVNCARPCARTKSGWGSMRTRANQIDRRRRVYTRQKVRLTTFLITRERVRRCACKKGRVERPRTST